MLRLSYLNQFHPGGMRMPSVATLVPPRICLVRTGPPPAEIHRQHRVVVEQLHIEHVGAKNASIRPRYSVHSMTWV